MSSRAIDSEVFGWSQESILNLSRAFTESRVLLTGAELDLFTLLAGVPLKAETIAQRIGGDLHALRIVLDALSAMGLLVKREGCYQTEETATRLLSANSPDCVLPMVLHNASLWERWGQLTRTVAGPKAVQNTANMSLRSFIGAMHVIAKPLAARIVSIVKPGNARRLLDVGGASGTYTIAFLRQAPQMRATLFDRLPVVEMARELIASAGMTDRVTLVEGDFYRDPLPAGHDLALVSAIIHQNTQAENASLFRKVFDALEPGGRIVVRDHVLSADRTGPKPGALFAVNMLAGGGGGNSYTYDEISDALTQGGFTRIRLVHPDERMDGVVEAFKPSP
jgi:precorrin-6B methylase 2